MKSRAKTGVFQRTVLASALCVLGLGQAHAVSFTQGDSTIDINGTINGFYSHRTAESGGEKTTNSALTNGLLPGWINFVFTTKVEGLDIKAHVGFAPGINDKSDVVGLPSNPGCGGATGCDSPFSQIDTRNLYFQFGSSDWGTVKLGRDIGLFGQKIILSDMTLLGLGGNSYAATPFNTTFGMIGHGYMYTGFQPQITYTTPTMSGFSASAGIFDPNRFAGDETKDPAFQGMLNYDWKGSSVSGSVWAGAVHQTTSGTGSFDANGYELGGKLGIGNFEAVAYGFRGKGLGLSTVGALYFSPFEKTEGKGYFVQGTYKFGKTKVGINYGENRDSDGLLTDTNKFKSMTVGVYHSLNKYITLVGEFNREKGTGSDVFPGDLKTRTISLGGIIFF
ncbi:MAG TPA: porin [Aromatoleum sp.]|uniref:porin n=1 Tax=Aromatoleum sp. TaxID=2307007 RepID=UPI002B468269|nr:porin [Aromatoleum sp.]HJV25423.1 porin [Aromatoleum sp.]